MIKGLCVVVLLVLAVSFLAGPLVDDSPLSLCYARCLNSRLLDLDWCTKACRCALGIEFCPPSDYVPPWKES